MDFITGIKERAKKDIKTVVLPESGDPRTLHAVEMICNEGFAKPVLLGDPAEIQAKAVECGADVSGAQIVNPIESENFTAYADKFYKMRKKKGVTPQKAFDLMKSPIHFGMMMVDGGEADGLVCGAIHSTADTLRPALQILKTAPNVKYVSGFMIMCVPDCEYGQDGTFALGDVGLTINPDVDQLSEIAIATATSFKQLVGGEPKVAMLSFSTYGSADDPLVDKVKEATSLVQEKAPLLSCDGEMQLDAAIIPSVGEFKAPGSPVAGHANVLIFPNLDCGNIAYKMTERMAKAKAYGPLIQGIRKPVNDLSRGCCAEDIVGVVAITCVQAQMNEETGIV